MIKDEILKTFDRRQVLVTGGTGLIGRQVVDLLCSAGACVKIVSLDRVKVRDGVEHILGDLTDFNFCKQATKNMDYVFHLAGVKGSIVVSKTMLASHFVPTLMMNTNMLEASRLNRVAKLVYTSSIGAYADAEIFRESDYDIASRPMDFAGWAKRVGELQIEAYKIQHKMENFAIVRPSNVYGPGDNFDPENAMVIPSLMCRIHSGENPLVVWGDGSAVRDFVYSRDVAEGILLALYHGTRGGFVNLGGGRGTSIKELVETLKGFIDFNFIFDASKPSGAPRKQMDITLAKSMIGYDPRTTLAEGLQITWNWFLENSQEYLDKKNYFKES
jgi:GDP-L-fucose synthase